MKKLILKLSILACLIGLSFDVQARYRGDLNGDDRVDLADMVYLAKAIKAGSTDKALDVNASGSVDDYDLQRLADIIISGKLTEDSGMNVGIGGWDDSGEDFGGTVKAPAINTRSGEETRFYMRNPKTESTDHYSMEFGISEGNEAPSAIFFNISLPKEMEFDKSRMIELENSISATHKLYGTPKFIKENEDIAWSDYALRFIIMSPNLTALPEAVGKLGRIYYSVDECYGSPKFSNCQIAMTNRDGCTYIDEHWAGYGGTFRPVDVSYIHFDQSEVSLTEGDEILLNANIEPWDATDQNLVWTSSDENIVTVRTEDGRNATIKAVKEGEATITASASNGVSASIPVKVEKRFIGVLGISLSHYNLSITEGDSFTIFATIEPEDATDKTISWQSSNESIAVVNANGAEATITGLAPGIVEISAIASNGQQVICQVNVEKRFIEVTGVTLSNEELKLIVGESATLIANVLPADATDKSLIWTSSDNSVATVSEEGFVSAIAPGNAVITVTTSNGKTATCRVVVESGIINVASVTLDKTELNLTEGDTANLIATVNPSDATDKTLSWTSSDESVATVSANGDVKAMKAGTATIIVSSTNGKTATCNVNVVAKIIEVVSVTLDKTSLKLVEGETATLIATVNPSNATDKSLTWKSSDESVATVSANGEVKALKPGAATITVSSANGKTAACSLTVEKRIIDVNGVSLSNKDLKLIVGNTVTLIATIQPVDATDQTLTWTSSNNSVATVSTDGIVTAISPGKAVITVSTTNGKTATCNVTVESGIIAVASVTLDKAELNLTEGDNAKLTATINPSDATDKTLTWISSDESVATVSSTGEVKALKAGTATIIVSSTNGKTATCNVNVAAKIIEVVSVTLDKTSLKLVEGESSTLTATVNPLNATDKTLTWKSSDESVASVSTNGEVNALKAGTATISVSSANGKTATCTVTVDKKVVAVTGIILSTKEMKLTEGESATLIATIQPADATDKTLTWSSSNTAVATVSANGEVQALKAGSSIITVKAANGVSATCNVTVESGVIAVASVTLDKTELNLTEGESATLTAAVNPSDATDKTLTWTSSDESVATVSAAGEVKALKAGTATIIVSSTNGKTATCNVNVAAKIIEVVSVTLDKTSLKLVEGESANLTATVNPSDATDKSLTWKSSDASIVSVSANGEVKALKAGTATITVSSANGKTATCTVTVDKKVVALTGIILSTKEMKLTEGESATLIATIQPADATDKSLTWTSSNTAVATVSANGEVKAIKAGNAVITVKAANGISATCDVTVESGVIAVASVTLDKSELNLTEGESAKLTATVNPSDATDKTLSWTSSDESVATVSATGEVMALKHGTATIIVSSSNGKTATCIVNVEAKVIEMEAIQLDTETLALVEGEKHQLIATVVPADTTYPDLEWWVDDEMVASTDQNGLVTMLREGETTVHVRSVYCPSVEATCHINVISSVGGLIEDNVPCDIYTTNGVLLKKNADPSDIENLSPGIYIIRQGGKTTKLLK